MFGEKITESQVKENKSHPIIYKNSTDSQQTEKLVGEFNKYFTRLKRMYMISKNEYEKTINDLKINEIMRLKRILKYFLHKDIINHDDVIFITKIIEEIHNIDYETRKKSEIKRSKNNNYKPQKPKTFKTNSFRHNNIEKPRVISNARYSPRSNYAETGNITAIKTTSSIKPIENSPEKKTSKSNNSHYLRKMNFQHNGNNKRK